MDLALNVFAPRPADTLFRTLQRKGKLIIAIPTNQHMADLRDSLSLLDVDRNKELRVARALDPFFKQLEHRFCRWNMELSHAHIAYLAGMGLPPGTSIQPH